MGNLTDILIQAGLLNEVQIQVAMHDLQMRPEMKFAEVLSVRGWIQEETVDFFELLWEMRLRQSERKLIGQYLLEARLITEAQLADILQEQRHSSLMFGEIAVLKGYLKHETVHFFVRHLYPDKLKISKTSPFARTPEAQSKSRSTMTNNLTVPQWEPEVTTDNQRSQQSSSAQPPQKTSFFQRFKQDVRRSPGETTKTKPIYRDHEAFSTQFDLSTADDFEMGHLE